MNPSFVNRANFFYVLRLVGGWLLIFFGLIVTPLPIPFGLIMIAFGLALLAQDSLWLQRKIRALRKRYPGMSAKLRTVEPHIDKLFGGLLRSTDPDRQSEKS